MFDSTNFAADFADVPWMYVHPAQILPRGGNVSACKRGHTASQDPRHVTNSATKSITLRHAASNRDKEVMSPLVASKLDGMGLD